MIAEKYKYSLSTGSGSTKIDMILNDDETALIEVDSNWMGSGKHDYRLSGKHLPVSPSYGWIQIEQVEHRWLNSEYAEQSEMLDVSIVGSSILYEYFKVPPSPNYEHLDDLGVMRDMGWAHWNETFDLLVIIQRTTEGNLLSLEHYGAVWSEEPVDSSQIERLLTALFIVEKTKFTRQTEDMPSNSDSPFGV